MTFDEAAGLHLCSVAAQAPAQAPAQPLPQPRQLPPSAASRFSAAERRLLLTTTGIGEVVVERIECAGVHSLEQLRELGVDTIVGQICDGAGNLAWRNRKRALLRALAAVAGS